MPCGRKFRCVPRNSPHTHLLIANQRERRERGSYFSARLIATAVISTPTLLAHARTPQYVSGTGARTLKATGLNIIPPVIKLRLAPSRCASVSDSVPVQTPPPIFSTQNGHSASRISGTTTPDLRSVWSTNAFAANYFCHVILLEVKFAEFH